MGLIRQLTAVVTIGAIRPGSRKQRTARKALAALEPSRESTSAPGSR